MGKHGRPGRWAHGEVCGGWRRQGTSLQLGGQDHRSAHTLNQGQSHQQLGHPIRQPTLLTHSPDLSSPYSHQVLPYIPLPKSPFTASTTESFMGKHEKFMLPTGCVVPQHIDLLDTQTHPLKQPLVSSSHSEIPNCTFQWSLVSNPKRHPYNNPNHIHPRLFGLCHLKCKYY
jgi:hypothetical protein